MFLVEAAIVIAASTVLDGRGGVLHNTRIVVEGSKIVRIDPKAKPVTYDLRGRTVLPGWIESHSHLRWSFGPDGKNVNEGGGTPEAAAANAQATLMAGFTTIQSPGAVNARITGPRVLSGAEPIMGQGEKNGTPDEIRAFVRKQKAAGADLLKIFASGGMRQGGMTLSQEQLNAACDEANKQGLRTLVHAYRDAIKGAVLAGCTEVEHGLGATDDDLKLLAEKGVYFDPQAGLLLETYLQFRDKYAGTPFFPAKPEAFEPMKDLLEPTRELMRRAAKVPGLKIVFGTDAVAGSHGRNAEEFVMRVRECGVDPMAAMVSANSRAAEALRMSDKIGAIAPGLEADIIALDGDPLRDIEAVRRVVFVMRGGVVHKK